MLRVLWSVYRAWVRYPHLRFGQLIWNATDGADLFYMENDEAVAEMDGYRPTAAKKETK
jgi:hypothetical protein